MRNSTLYVCIFVFLFSPLRQTEVYASRIYAVDRKSAEQSDGLLKKLLTEVAELSNIAFRGERIHSSVMLAQFYERRNFRLAWHDNYRPLSQADDLINAIEDAYHDGLAPNSYHLELIHTLREEARRNQEGGSALDHGTLVQLDLLLTDAFLMLTCHYSAGCVNPITTQMEWFANRSKQDVVAVLEQALQGKGIKKALWELVPAQDNYIKLKHALAQYRGVAAQGGWPTLSNGPIMKFGTNDERLHILRRRLTITGDLATQPSSQEDFFSEPLQNAVVRFQERHGLKADGIVGPQTLRALNVPTGKRVRQIMLNMERLRWSFRNLGEQYILINIADFSLDVVENNHTVLSVKAVVGKPYWHTPVFKAKLTYVVLNPSWNIPESIVLKDLLPKIQEDEDYLFKHDLVALQGWGENEEEIDPKRIDWSLVSQENLNFRLRQEPGPFNPLGRIKFMFPNQFNVYIHDSPDKGLFKNNVRSFSHGCIRIEKPIDLAEYLFQGDPDWRRENILKAIQSGEELAIGLPQPINVHILYLTAWVDENGVLQFRNDIYGRDERLGEALFIFKKPPSL